MRHFDQFRYLPIKVTRDEWGRESHLIADCQNRGNLMCNLYVVFSNPCEAVAPPAISWIYCDEALSWTLSTFESGLCLMSRTLLSSSECLLHFAPFGNDG